MPPALSRRSGEYLITSSLPIDENNVREPRRAERALRLPKVWQQMDKVCRLVEKAKPHESTRLVKMRTMGVRRHERWHTHLKMAV